MAVADSGYTYLTEIQTYSSGHLLDTGWLIAYLALALGAIYAVVGRPKCGPVTPSQRSSLRRSMLIYVPPGIMAIVAAIAISRGGPIDRVLWLVGLVTVLLLGVRQLLALSENAALTDALEVRVVTRTAELHHQALHDALTGLPNRTLVLDRIDQMLERSRRANTSCAVLYMDLDGFKAVNDSFGHGVGDRLLQAVALRVSGVLRHTETVGRMGGDEFVVLAESENPEFSAEDLAQRLLEAVREPFQIDAIALAITVSIGIATGDRASPGELLRDADMALYEAKAAGKDRSAPFRADLQYGLQDRLELELDLRFALERDEYRLVYQPVHDLKIGLLVGVEALVRWHHPTRGVVAPDAFVPVLEDSGAIIDVGRWVLNEACRQTAAWHEHGETLHVAVNVSSRQLDDNSIVDDVARALTTSGLDPTALVIEVTETAVMRNTEKTARRLQDLRDLGVRVSIDDFGTGYSSLAYLQRLPVDTVKIDQAFTRAIGQSSESATLLHTLI